MRSGHASLLLAIALVVLPSAAFAVDIGALHCNDANGNNLNIGQTVTVTGVVTELANTSTSFRFYIQDATGGINVFGAYSGTAYAACPGGQLTVTGTIAQFNGLTELSVPLTFVLGSPWQPEPAYLPLTPAQINATYQSDNCEPREGLLIVVSCCYIRTSTGAVPAPGATFASGNYRLVDVNDPTSYITMYISPAPTATCTSSDDILGAPIPTWPVTVSGVLSQYDTSSPYTAGYEVIPRGWVDFLVCGACCNRDYGSDAGYCQMRNEPSCMASGGNWQGANVPCPNSCVAIDATKTTWGRIKTLYR